MPNNNLPYEDNTEYEKNKKIGNTIKQARLLRNETLEEFGQKFAQFAKRKSPYTKSAINAWEKGNLPDIEVRKLLCQFLNLEYEVLDCGIDGMYKEYDIKKISSLFQSLQELSKQPVWCEFNKSTHEGTWAIVNNEKNCLICSHNKTIPFEKINFNIYKYPPQHIHSAESLLEPLSKDDVYDKVWIEPLCVGYENRHSLMEWATNYDIIDSYISESGLIYPHEDNGRTYLCYRDLS